MRDQATFRVTAGLPEMLKGRRWIQLSDRGTGP